MRSETAAISPAAPLGLVLAGGASRRMGEDKGAIVYRGSPQAAFLTDLLARYCSRVFVSINSSQAGQAPYTSLPVLVDAGPSGGPASGLLAARQEMPDSAWLVVSVDLVLLNERVIDRLIDGRRIDAAATAFCNIDGRIEPLCAIWEPAGLTALAARVAIGDRSPRRCLEAVDIELLGCPDPRALTSIDTPEARASLAEKFRA